MDYEEDDGFEELDPERRAELSRRSAELLVRAERTLYDDDETKDLRRAATRELLARVRATLEAPRPEGDPWVVPPPQAASATPAGAVPRYVAKVTIAAPPPSNPTTGWQRWIRNEIDRRLKAYSDAAEAGIAKFVVTYSKAQRVPSDLCISERRVARLEAERDKAEVGASLRIVSGRKP